MARLLEQLSKEMADLVEGAAESVLRVDARRRLPATGIVWSDNLILTAHHVVESEDGISVGLADGSQVGAALIGRDPRIDLALLRIDANLKPAQWSAGEDLRVGQLALALGRPRQHIRASLGVVTGSARSPEGKRQFKRMKAQLRGRMKGDKQGWRRRAWRRRRAWDGGAWSLALAGGAIHTDVAMYPGFSGGPLLGVDGMVYGMNTSGFRGGVSTAIPLASIRESVATLLEKGKIQTGYLGIGVQTAQLPDGVAASLEQDAGLLIVSIEADSPAAKAGLLVGDILTALGGDAMEHVDELQIALARLAVGSEADLQFARGGAIQAGSVVIGER
ncbi:MAG: trypsin-like peptidase domain-containing protein [Chloroflexi bacterium]|nr:trypsin-like peptidase domain-containing protein [Chloroflexota bacterium]